MTTTDPTPAKPVAATTYRNTYLEVYDIPDSDNAHRIVACGIDLGYTHDTPDDAISTLRRLVDAFHASAAGGA
jgi:hypothetical protein